MSIELKIKAKHLALEPAIIRLEEKRLKKKAQWLLSKQESGAAAYVMAHRAHLNKHRRQDVKRESRATELARAFIAGKPYSTVEQKRHESNEFQFKHYVIPRVVAMVNKYDVEKYWKSRTVPITKEEILEWAKIS